MVLIGKLNGPDREMVLVGRPRESVTTVTFYNCEMRVV